MKYLHDNFFDLHSTTRMHVPAVPFGEIARHILGARYSLSLVVCGDALARRVNREYRGKAYAPNVLSFPLSVDAGEIFLNARQARREARSEHTTLSARLTYLFIHGCLHLKGMKHGDVMDRAEDRAMARFGIR